MLIVKSGVVPISSSLELFVLKIKIQYCHFTVYPEGQPANLQVQVLRQVRLENDLFTLSEKSCYTRYLLLHVLIITFLVFYFRVQFYSNCWCKHHETLYTLNHSESEIKF